MPEGVASGALGAGYAGASLAVLLAAAGERLGRAGVADFAIDARRLASAATGRSAAELIATLSEPLQPVEIASFERMIARRAAREPVSRIVGRRGFWTLDLLVTPDVLDPRPETETLVETALDIARRIGRPGLRLLDVGTGSGAVLLALLSELPSATGLGSDISQAALEVARANASRLGLSGRADFQLADGLAGIEGPFDLLISNPPYIESDAIAGLDPEVARFDPLIALDGGPDGLAAYRAIAARLKPVIPDGWAAFEVGRGQDGAVLAILRDALAPHGPFVCERGLELSGMTRVVAAKTQS